MCSTSWPSMLASFVFRFHLIEQAFTDVNRAAGQREGVDHVVIWNQVKLVGQMTVSVRGNGASDAANIFLERFFFRRSLSSLRPE